MVTELITKKQIARIRASAHALSLSREQLYALVSGGSISHLTRGVAARVIDKPTERASGSAAPAAHPPEHAPGSPWQITAAQRALIEHLFERLRLDRQSAPRSHQGSGARAGLPEEVRARGRPDAVHRPEARHRHYRSAESDSGKGEPEREEGRRTWRARSVGERRTEALDGLRPAAGVFTCPEENT